MQSPRKTNTTTITTSTQTLEAEPGTTVVLHPNGSRENSAEKKRVVWTQDTIDNEDMNKKKSKYIQSSDQNILAQYMLDIVMQSDDEALKEQFREDWSRGIHQNPSADLVGVFIEFLFAIVIVLASIREICGRT